MKITIDTKEDSHEELRKVIKMLSSLVGQEVMSNQSGIFGSDNNSNGSSDIFSGNNSSNDSSEGSGNGIFDMFNSGSGIAGSENIKEKSKDKKEGTDDDIGIDIPELEEYH